MKTTNLISSPTQFIVESYEPGFTIDFRKPASFTDLDRTRSSFDFKAFDVASSEAEFARLAGRALVDLGIAEDEADFAASLHAYTGEEALDAQLSACLELLDIRERPRSPGHALELLFERTGCLKKNTHYAVRLHCHVPGAETALEDESTHYGYVLDGECVAVEDKRSVTLSPNTFFCIAGNARIEGTGRCVIVTHFGFKGITQYGGEVEGWGRLNYIDGCTDTLLVPPLKKGDPCYNVLYFPSATEQTQHLHPSLRCGLVIAGSGTCKTPYGDHPLEVGNLFFLPPETYHSFHTAPTASAERSALTVIAFHPDSDFGPTDTDHPMINRTYFKFLHRLTSSGKEGHLLEARAA